MVNHFILQGRLTADPELKTSQNGKDYVPFTVAWSEKRKEYESKLFLPCIAWSGTANLVCNHFAKGQEIIVSGRLLQNVWEDDSGNKRHSFQMQVSKVDFAGPKRERPSVPAASAPPEDFTDMDIGGDGELPF